MIVGVPTGCADIMRYPGLMRVVVDFSLCPTSYRRDTTMRVALLV
jgi:hypothetical protein